MPCQNGHWGHILPHVEIVGRDLLVCKDITADGGFTATNIQFITLKKRNAKCQTEPCREKKNLAL